ncbi:MAG: hypothetical protein ACRDJF_12285 [Actinomycetota bacterium]
MSRSRHLQARLGILSGRLEKASEKTTTGRRRRRERREQIRVAEWLPVAVVTPPRFRIVTRTRRCVRVDRLTRCGRPPDELLDDTPSGRDTGAG